MGAVKIATVFTRARSARWIRPCRRVHGLKAYLQCRSICAIIALGLATAASAQQASLPLSFRAMLRAGELVRGGSGEAVWAKNGDGLWYRTDGSLKLFRPGHSAPVARLSEADLRTALVGRFGETARTAPLPLAQFVLARGILEFNWGAVPVTFDLGTGKLGTTSASGGLVSGRFERNLFIYPGYSAPDVPSHDGSRLATVEHGNISVRGVGETTQLTTDASSRWGWDLESGRADVANLKAAPVSPWSPDDRWLFAMRLDRRDMPQVADSFALDDPPGKVIMRDVFRAGGPYYHYAPAVIDVASGAVRPLTGVTFGNDHLMLLDWSEDAQTVYVGAIDHAMTRARIVSANVVTGVARVIFTETAVGALRPPHQIYYAGNMGFTLLPNGRGFLWQSERDGWNQLYHYDLRGRLVRQLTKAPYPVEQVKAVDLVHNRIFFTARADVSRPYDVHLLSVPLNGGPARRLTAAPGVHDVTLSPDKLHFLDRWSAPSSPPEVAIRAVTDGTSQTVDRADMTGLIGAGWQPPVEFKVKAADGVTDVYGTMYRPFTLDPEKKYPVIEDIYGGPTLINADHEFVAAPPGAGGYHSPNFPLALAQLGYLVVKFDTPGTPGRSRAFGLAARDLWGPGIAADHAAVIRNLAVRYPYVDSERVGIFGHSWGGLNAVFALATQRIYRAAVATGVGADREGWRDGFMEAYLGTPKDHPERWQRQDIFKQLDKVDRPLMLGAGTQDYVLATNTLRISQALIARGVMHEYVPAPGSAHGILGPSGAYFIDKTALFFLKAIPPGGLARK